MKKWYDEEYKFEIEVTGLLRGDHTERYCRNGEEIGTEGGIVFHTDSLEKVRRKMRRTFECYAFSSGCVSGSSTGSIDSIGRTSASGMGFPSMTASN